MPVYRCTMTCLVDGQTCQNVIHLARDASDFGELAICDKLAAAWLPHITPFQHSGALWVSVEVRSVAPSGPATFKKVIAITGAGPAEADSDNSMLCRMLSFRTAHAGRHGRGFLFIPGTSFQAWSKGLIKPASLTAGTPLVNNLKTNWIGDAPAQGLQLVISPKSNPANFVSVVDILQDTTVRSLSRRRLGRGI
jgi:hypothetical protein